MTRRTLQNFLVQRKNFFYVVCALIGFFLLVNYVFLPWYVNHGSRLSVPSVIGMTTEKAKEVLEGASLQTVEADIKPDPSQPAGVVINQNPLPNAVVKDGRRVYLTISGGEVLVSVPLLRGRSLRDARFALERFGLTLGAVSYAGSETFPENTIMDQAVAADSKIGKGSGVGITVSRGALTQDIVVPQVIGKSIGEAEKILAQAGLKVGIITFQPSFDLLPNTVVDQFPRVGDPARQGQEVDLFIVRVGKPTEEIQTPKN